MQDEVYADRIGEITISGPIVRIDLVSLSVGDKDSAGQPAFAHRQRIIMSVEGFANSFEVLQKAMHGLIEAGAVRRTTQSERQPAASPAGSASSGPAPVGKLNGGTTPLNGSPNFA